MKGAVDLITIIIVACMVVSIGLMFWFYLNSYYSQVSQTGEAKTQRSLETLSSCMRIEEAFQNKFFIRNCGTGLVTNDSLNVYIDGELKNFNLTPSSIDGGKTGTLNLKSWGLSVGQHTLRITNPNVETSTMFDASLPDSCVLALDFDEGSGNIAYDKSEYKNGGILGNGMCSPGSGSCPNWINGYFGKALAFDNDNDYVKISPSDSLNLSNTFTFEAWIYPIEWGEGGYGRVIHKNTGYTASDGYGLYIRAIYNDLAVWFGNQFYDTGDNSINLNVWQHVAATFNETHINFYINGDNVKTTLPTTTVPNNTRPLYIGNDEEGSLARTFNGTIDSIRIYNKALTPDETLNFRII